MIHNLDTVHHFPPDVTNAVVDAIPLITRGRMDVLTFFRGCGVDREFLKTIERKVESDTAYGKYAITRDVLTCLNDLGDVALMQRREVLRRLAEFDNFASCYPDNQLKAKGAVTAVAELVNRKDSFTRLQQAHERELQAVRQRSQVAAELAAAKRAAKEAVKLELYALFGNQNTQRRGLALQGVLNRLFAVYGILVREEFVVVGERGEGAIEQIDGAVEIDGQIYLVEMKWWEKKLARADVASHLVSVYGRDGVGGIFISASGYMESAIAEYKTALSQRTVVLVELREVVTALERDVSLMELIQSKLIEAKLRRLPLYYPLSDD